MSYNLILIEADPIEHLKGSCLQDLKNFLNYCRLVIGCENILMVYVLTNRELTNTQKLKFLIPTKKTAITFIHFSLEKKLFDIVKYFQNQEQPLLIYISEHNSQIHDRKNKIITHDKLTQLVVSHDKMVICIVDTNHSESMVDLNYQYDGDEFCQHRVESVPETQAFYIGAYRDDTFYTDEETNFTVKIIEERILNDFLRDPTIENITKAYDGLEYFMRFHGKKPNILTNYLDEEELNNNSNI